MQRCLQIELPWPCLLVLSNWENMALAVQEAVSKILRASSCGEQHKAAAGRGKSSFMAKIGIDFREAADSPALATLVGFCESPAVLIACPAALALLPLGGLLAVAPWSLGSTPSPPGCLYHSPAWISPFEVYNRSSEVWGGGRELVHFQRVQGKQPVIRKPEKSPPGAPV